MYKVIFGLLLVGVVYIFGFCRGASWIFNRNLEFVRDGIAKKNVNSNAKWVRMFRILDTWMKKRYTNSKVADYLKKMNYNNIALYGVGYLGRHLVEELSDTDVRIEYIIDKRVENIEEEIVIYRPTDDFPNTDVIIVTAIADFDEIVETLEKKVSCPILSLEEIIWDM